MKVVFRRKVFAALCLVALAACLQLPPQPPADSLALPREIRPLRFLLTFDDGPSSRSVSNPTRKILDVLAQNRVQSGIKAVFFVQTRSAGKGGDPIGRALLRRMHADGHLLALHSGSARGHVSHRRLAPGDLEQSLRDGVTDIEALTGRTPALVRPPFWSYDESVLNAYRRFDLEMLLTDIRANDGKAFGFVASPRRQQHFRSRLSALRAKIETGEITPLGSITPIVVTFHDTNIYTARHLEEYLTVLIKESARAGLKLDAKPFFDDWSALEHAALARASAWNDARLKRRH